MMCRRMFLTGSRPPLLHAAVADSMTLVHSCYQPIGLVTVATGLWASWLGRPEDAGRGAVLVCWAVLSYSSTGRMLI